MKFPPLFEIDPPNWTEDTFHNTLPEHFVYPAKKSKISKPMIWIGALLLLMFIKK